MPVGSMREAVIAAASSSKPEPELISSHFHNNVLACCLDPDLWDPKEAVAFDAISTAGRASSHAGKKHVLTCRVLRIVSHLDMDVFFAAVEERDNPSLNGLPVVGGADPRGGRAGGPPPRVTGRASMASIPPCLSQRPGGCRSRPGSEEVSRLPSSRCVWNDMQRCPPM